MAGVKGRSGRKRNIRNIQKYYNEQFDLRSASLIETLLDEANGGNATALIYAFDRRLGKPKVQADVTSGGEKMGAGFLVELFSILEEGQRKLKGGYSPLQIAEGTTEKGDKDAIQRPTEAEGSGEEGG